MVYNSGYPSDFFLISESSQLFIKGTSSIHDWEMEVTGFKAETLLKINENAIAEIKQIQFLSPVSGLKSGKNIMDKKAHDALKEKKFPAITFTLDKNNPIKISGKKTEISGNLTIAGKTREVELTADFYIKTSHRFQVKGNVPLKMSHFGIDPPTALMGALKTDDQIEITFSLMFEQSGQEFSDNY